MILILLKIKLMKTAGNALLGYISIAKNYLKNLILIKEERHIYYPFFPKQIMRRRKLINITVINMAVHYDCWKNKRHLRDLVI